AAGSARSVGTASAVPPPVVISASAAARSSASRARRLTAAPARASLAAVAWPRPLLAPVTIATRPASVGESGPTAHYLSKRRPPQQPNATWAGAPARGVVLPGGPVGSGPVAAGTRTTAVCKPAGSQAGSTIHGADVAGRCTTKAGMALAI